MNESNVKKILSHYDMDVCFLALDLPPKETIAS